MLTIIIVPNFLNSSMNIVQFNEIFISKGYTGKQFAASIHLNLLPVEIESLLSTIKAISLSYIELFITVVLTNYNCKEFKTIRVGFNKGEVRLLDTIEGSVVFFI